jgi:hypothetical protein
VACAKAAGANLVTFLPHVVSMGREINDTCGLPHCRHSHVPENTAIRSAATYSEHLAQVFATRRWIRGFEMLPWAESAGRLLTF